MFRVLDLFSGIGGFSLGLERTAGFETVAFCEIDPFCRRVLGKHWPTIPCYDDVRSVTADRVHADGIHVDVIVGGFPCQDLSYAGAGAGLSGERSGLWWEFHRIISEVRPSYAIIENVPALRTRGLDVVLGSLSAIGFDAEWHLLPASSVGAPHRRDRCWIIAYPRGVRRSARWTGEPLQGAGMAGQTRSLADVADAAPMLGAAVERREPHGDHARVGAVADPQGGGQPVLRRAQGQAGLADGGCTQVADTGIAGLPISERPPVLTARRWQEGRAASERGWWAVEPGIRRVAASVPHRVDRLRSLGNAVVPAIPEAIGYAILEDMKHDRS